jgi:hypothetical protein
VSFGSRGIYAYDLDGRLLWERDFDIRMRMFNGFGEGVSPVVEDGRLILLFDHDAHTAAGLVVQPDLATSALAATGGVGRPAPGTGHEPGLGRLRGREGADVRVSLFRAT